MKYNAKDILTPRDTNKFGCKVIDSNDNWTDFFLETKGKPCEDDPLITACLRCEEYYEKVTEASSKERRKGKQPPKSRRVSSQ